MHVRKSITCSLLLLSLTLTASSAEPEPVLQFGHLGDVRWMALSADGTRLVSSSYDTTAVLWNVETGEALRTFTGLQTYNGSLLLSPDGKRLMTLSRSGPILWDTASGKRIREFPQSATCMSMSISADWSRLVTGHQNDTAILWNVDSGQQIRRFKSANIFRDHRVSQICISADGSRILTSSESNPHLFLWNAETGEQIRKYSVPLGKPGRARGVDYAKLTANGKLFISIHETDTDKGLTRIVTIWNAETGETLRTFDEVKGKYSGLVVSDDGKRMIAKTSDYSVLLIDLQTGKTIRTFKGHTGNTHAAAFSDNVKQMVTASDDHRVIVWNMETGTEVRTIATSPVTPMYPAVVDSDGKPLITVSTWMTSRFWDFDSGEPKIKSVTYSEDSSLVVAHHNPKASLLVSGGKLEYAQQGRRVVAQRTLILTNCSNGAKITTETGHLPSVGGILSNDGKRLISPALDDKDRKSANLILWDVETGKYLRTFKSLAGGLTCPSITADDRHLIAISDSASAVIWKIETGEMIKTFRVVPSNSQSRTLMTDDAKLLITTTGEETLVWNIQTERIISTLRGQQGSIRSWILTRDGRQIFTYSEDGTIILWKLETGEIIKKYTGPTDAITMLTPSKDEQRLQATSDDGTTQFWDVASGRELGTLYCLNLGKDWLILTPDGQYESTPNAAKFIRYRTAGTNDLLPTTENQKQSRTKLLTKIMSVEKP